MKWCCAVTSFLDLSTEDRNKWGTKHTRYVQQDENVQNYAQNGKINVWIEAQKDEYVVKCNTKGKNSRDYV